jgi:hypothetical protein
VLRPVSILAEWSPISPVTRWRKVIQLSLEYDPDPPFASGHPDRASESVMTPLSSRYEQARANFRAQITLSMTG